MVDIEARQAQVLGDGPRIEPLKLDELTDELSAMLMRMIEINSVLDSRDVEMLTDLMTPEAAPASQADLLAMLANLPEIVRTMVRHPALFARQTDLGIQLLGQGVLAGRDRELAILRIAWLCQAPYEWGEHVLIAKKVGITSAEIERITVGSGNPDWGEHERALLRAAEELHKDAMISDSTWAILAARLNEPQLIELPILIGQYQAVAYYQNSLRLRLHDGNLGLKAR
jgi:alkylhydroperoxidase family enzyme